MLLEVCLFLLSAIGLYALLEHHSYQMKRAGLPGPRAVPPFIGKIVDMIRRPFDFYEEQRQYGPLSWNAIFGRFFLFVADTEVTRKVFSNFQDSFRLQLTLGAPIMLGKEKNIAFMNGPPHKALRKMLLPLFTRKALGMYLSIQEKTIRQHLAKWVEKSQSEGVVEIRSLVRDVNVETSFKVFVGPYIKTGEQLVQMSKLYFKLNEGFLAVPIVFPGTTLWYAVRAREKLIKIMTPMVAESRVRMAGGDNAECLLDVWMQSVKVADAETEGEEAARITAQHNTNSEIAFHILDFLFASQDASTSSLVWMFALLNDYPDVLRRVRQEQHRLRPDDDELTADVVDKMEFTSQVVREVLRFRPPVTMVPHVAAKDCKLTENYTVRKGTIILPYIWAAHHEDFPNGYSFDPDRWSPEKWTGQEAKSFLSFGHGPHQCIGQRYAMNHLTAFAALLSTLLDWEREVTTEGDKIIYGPTIYPADGCRARLNERPWRSMGEVKD